MSYSLMLPRDALPLFNNVPLGHPEVGFMINHGYDNTPGAAHAPADKKPT
jgi:hypothetical protein